MTWSLLWYIGFDTRKKEGYSEHMDVLCNWLVISKEKLTRREREMWIKRKTYLLVGEFCIGIGTCVSGCKILINVQYQNVNSELFVSSYIHKSYFLDSKQPITIWIIFLFLKALLIQVWMSANLYTSFWWIRFQFTWNKK